jgi:hypothetical protein
MRYNETHPHRLAINMHTAFVAADGLRQYSLTPHPNALPQDFLDQQRAESAALLNRGLKSKIIRFVCIDIRLPDGTPYSLTPK